MVTLRTTALLILLTIACQLNAQTLVSGLVSGTWESSGNPYIVEGNLFVGPDDRLTIKSGVEVFFNGDFGIDVYGRFDVNGTPDGPVLFSLLDTTGFAAGETGWKGISFSGSGAGLDYSNLKHVIVEYSTGNGVTCWDFPQLLIENSTFRNNMDYGLAFYQFSNAIVEGVEISNNASGGIDIEFSTPQVSDFLIENNGGSGINLFGDLNGGTPTSFSQGEIRNNHSTGNGGGICLVYNFTVEMKDVNIHHNSAEKGGGIYTLEGFAFLENSIIQSNQAEYGGGLYNDFESDINLHSCVITDNYAEFDGGALYVEEAHLEVERTTISNNQAGNAAGGLYYAVENAMIGSISSSILWGNFPQEIVVPSVKLNITYTNIAEDYYGIGNINADPMFVNADDGNYQLSWNDYPAINSSKSPCIDAGDPNATADPDGTVADMGAFYYYQSTITQVEQHVNAAISVYPNPASSSIRLNSTDTPARILVADMTGRVVLEVTGETINSAINISMLKPGVYFVVAAFDNGTSVTEKMIKE